MALVAQTPILHSNFLKVKDSYLSQWGHNGGDVNYPSWTGQLLDPKLAGACILGDHKVLRQE